MTRCLASLVNLPRVPMRFPDQAGGPSEEAGWGAPPQGEAEDAASARGPRGRTKSSGTTTSAGETGQPPDPRAAGRRIQGALRH